MLGFQVLVCVTMPRAQLNFLLPPDFFGVVGQGIAVAMVTYTEASYAYRLPSNL